MSGTPNFNVILVKLTLELSMTEHSVVVIIYYFMCSLLLYFKFDFNYLTLERKIEKKNKFLGVKNS